MFALSDAMSQSLNFDDLCFYLDITNSITNESVQELVHYKPFKESLDDLREGDIPSLPNENETEV